MILPTCSGVDTCKLSKCQSCTEHNSGNENDSIEQGHSSAGLDGNGETGCDGNPAVGDVVTYRDDAEYAKVLLHRRIGEACHGDLAVGEFDRGSREVMIGLEVLFAHTVM
ncbi:unnamed protein product [Aspergillus oryzae]|nr:unnamed protein product [Aspergillus oryzae]